jgi:hypothetical protein
MATLNTKELKGLFSRVNKNQMEENDGRDITEFAKRVFGDGSVSPDPSMLHQFNNLIVQQADEVAKPMVTDMLSLFATVRNAERNNVVKYEIPQKAKAKVRWSANGSGVDLVRVEGKKHEIAVPKAFSTGFYYETQGMTEDAVASTQRLINNVAEAKVKLYLDQVYKLIDAAIAGGDIPAANVLSGDNLTLAQYNKLASKLARYGGRPVFVADTLLIDHFAMQQTSDATYKELLTDPTREELLHALNPSKIGRTDAANLVNPFIDDANSKVELPVNQGYMFAGSQAQKPFVVVEFGGLRQFTEQSMEDERVKMKIVQDADVELIFGQTIAKVQENTAVAL